METSLLVITLKRAQSHLHGSSSQDLLVMVDMDFLKSVSGSLSISTMMRPQISGIRRLESRSSEFSGAIWQITSGQWACRDLVGLALKFTMTAALLMELKVGLSPMRTDIWKCGTSSSCRTNVGQAAVKIVIRFLVSSQQRALILA